MLFSHRKFKPHKHHRYNMSTFQKINPVSKHYALLLNVSNYVIRSIQTFSFLQFATICTTNFIALQMIPMVDMLPGGFNVGQELSITGSTHINAARFVEFLFMSVICVDWFRIIYLILFCADFQLIYNVVHTPLLEMMLHYTQPLTSFDEYLFVIRFKVWRGVSKRTLEAYLYPPANNFGCQSYVNRLSSW